MRYLTYIYKLFLRRIGASSRPRERDNSKETYFSTKSTISYTVGTINDVLEARFPGETTASIEKLINNKNRTKPIDSYSIERYHHLILNLFNMLKDNHIDHGLDKIEGMVRDRMDHKY